MIKPKENSERESLNLSRKLIIREQVFRFKQKKGKKSLTKEVEEYTSYKNY